MGRENSERRAEGLCVLRDFWQLEVPEERRGLRGAEDLISEGRRDLRAQLANAGRLRRGQQLSAIGLDGRSHVTCFEKVEHIDGIARDALRHPVGARHEVETALREHRPQPRDLGPERDLLGALAVDPERELARSEPRRPSGEERQDLRVPTAQLERCTIDGGESGTVDTERTDPARRDGVRLRRGSGVNTQLRRVVREQHGESHLRLGGGDRGAHQGKRVWADGSFVTREVDSTDRDAGKRVVDGHGGAAEQLDGRREVLRPCDLDASTRGERGPWGARSDGGLRPIGALDEVHALGSTERGTVATHPEQPSLLVRDRDDQTSVPSWLHEKTIEHGEDTLQGAALSRRRKRLELVEIAGPRVRWAPEQLQRSQPGVADDAAESGDR
ncbi:hypothetical protein PSCLAVI8L_130210 [Pseudoclavibacter sp. 8L]|nr:hypothetical protein PSCLAVI8L_130210 [Pseudoclavibacter sp. 8L]